MLLTLAVNDANPTNKAMQWSAMRGLGRDNGEGESVILTFPTVTVWQGRSRATTGPCMHSTTRKQ